MLIYQSLAPALTTHNSLLRAQLATPLHHHLKLHHNCRHFNHLRQHSQLTTHYSQLPAQLATPLHHHLKLHHNCRHFNHLRQHSQLTTHYSQLPAQLATPLHHHLKLHHNCRHLNHLRQHSQLTTHYSQLRRSRPIRANPCSSVDFLINHSCNSCSHKQPRSIPQTFPIPAMTTHCKTLYYIIRVHSCNSWTFIFYPWPRLFEVLVSLSTTCASTHNSLLTTHNWPARPRRPTFAFAYSSILIIM